MPAACSAYNCSNRHSPSVKRSFFRFPFLNREQLKKWVVALRREDWQPTKSSFLCSDHFEEKCFRYNNERRSLVPNAVPTIFSFSGHLAAKQKTARSLPKKRARLQKEVEEEDERSRKQQKIEENSQATGYAAPRRSSHLCKGDRFLRFLESPTRRAKCVENDGRQNWQPGRYAALCKNHFEEIQDERLICDNEKRKLRRPAIPTSFGVDIPQKQIKGIWPASSNVAQQKIVEPAADPLVTALVDHSYASVPSVKLLEVSRAAKGSTHLDSSILAVPAAPTLKDHGPEPISSLDISAEELVSADVVDGKICVSDTIEEQTSVKLQRTVWRLEKELAKVKKENKRLKKMFETKLGPLSFLNKEQQKMVYSGKRIKEWTPESIEDALQLRFAVGRKGYQHLVRRGYPLPAYSTICRRLKSGNSLMPSIP